MGHKIFKSMFRKFILLAVPSMGVIHVCKSSLLLEKLNSPHGGPCYLSIVPIKDSQLFKIIESVFSFYLKLHNFKQVKAFYWNGGPHHLSTMKTL